MVITKVVRIPQIQPVAVRQSSFRESDSARPMWLDLSVGVQLTWLLKSSIWKGNVFNALDRGEHGLGEELCIAGKVCVSGLMGIGENTTQECSAGLGTLRLSCRCTADSSVSKPSGIKTEKGLAVPYDTTPIWHPKECKLSHAHGSCAAKLTSGNYSGNY